MKISCGHSKREEIFWGLLKSLMEKGICKIAFRDSGGEKTEDKKKRQLPENESCRFFLILTWKTLKDDELQSAIRIILIKTRKPKNGNKPAECQKHMPEREGIP